MSIEYSKPKVTIDLDEYNELLTQKDAVVGDEYVNMAKEVVITVIENISNLNRVTEILSKKGINFAIYNNKTGSLRTEVTISKIKA